MDKTRRRLALMGLTALIVAVALTIFFRGNEPGPPEMPQAWELISEEGDISSPCIGGAWEECGQIEKIYEVDGRPAEALLEFRSSMQRQGWTIESQHPSRLSALRSDESARVYVRTEGSIIVVNYVER